MARPRASVIPEKEPASRQFAPTLVDSPGRRPSPWGLPEWVAIAQVLGPALLFLPGTQRFRVILRTGVFFLGLLGIVACMRRPRTTSRHPSWTLLAIAAAYMMVMVLHPTTNSLMAGLAQVAMHLAVAAPIFWAPRYFLGDYRRLARLLTILWVLNGASVVVGILQVRDPGRWMPAEFSSVVGKGKIGLAMYSYRAGDGKMALRPPGLGDAPGAACGAGVFVATVGLAYLGLPVSGFRKLLGLAGGIAGVTVIFLTHVRSALVVLVGSAVVYLVILVLQRRIGTALMLAGSMVVGGVGSLRYASSIGGQSTLDRFATLLEDDPMTVYKRSARLDMVAGTFDAILLEYPLGAGLGRWGMTRQYFGNPSNLDSPSIWAEVQFPAWALDGGVVLLSLYLVALVVAVGRLLLLCLRHHSDLLRRWGAVILMLSAGPIALMFSYTPFNSQMGMQFWLLIGAIEGVLQGEGGKGREPQAREPRARSRKPD